MLVTRRHDDDRWNPSCRREFFYHVEAAEPRHLEVEKNQFRRKLQNRNERSGAIRSLTDDLDFVQLLQFFAENLSGNRLIVDNQCLHAHYVSSVSNTSIPLVNARNGTRWSL